MTHRTEFAPRLVKQDLFTRAHPVYGIGFLTPPVVTRSGSAHAPSFLCWRPHQSLLIAQKFCCSSVYTLEAKGASDTQHSMIVCTVTLFFQNREAQSEMPQEVARQHPWYQV